MTMNVESQENLQVVVWFIENPLPWLHLSFLLGCLECFRYLYSSLLLSTDLAPLQRIKLLCK